MIKRISHARQRQESGFTLIELLVVIIILGILAAVVVFAVRGAGDKGQASAVSSDEKTIRTAQESFCARFGQYGSSDQLVGLADAPGGGRYKFLSDKPQYHNVYAVNNGGPCNGWSFAISPTESGFLPTSGQWTDTNSYPLDLNTQSMVQLGNGKVLALGNLISDGSPAAALYDPGAGAWSMISAPPGLPSDERALVLLTGTPAQCGANCGKVLAFLRGLSTDPNNWRLYNPNDGQWETLPAVPTSFSSAGCCGVNGAVLLSDNCGTNCGKVFITTGDGARTNPKAELYDPAANSFAQIDYPNDSISFYGDLVRLHDGRVLMVGDYVCEGSACSSRAVLFDPVSAQFKPAASPSNGYMGLENLPPPVLPNGDILYTNNAYSPDFPGEIYRPDPSGGPGKWLLTSTCSPTYLPFCNTLTSLGDGRVLAVTTSDYPLGGQQTGQTFIFDPAQQKWFRTGDLGHPPDGANSAITLSGSQCADKCGKVLVAGIGTSQLFTP